MNDSRGRDACRVYKPLSPTLPRHWASSPQRSVSCLTAPCVPHWAEPAHFLESHPVYNPSVEGASLPFFRSKSRARERMIARAGGAYLVKADISQFSPSLYTHVVG